MSRKVLGISWLNGRFHAVALEGRKVSASWSAPERINDESTFGETLAEAVRQTCFAGRDVLLVLDHRSLLFQVQETPPVADKLVDQILDRAIERNPLFDEKPVWARLGLPPVNGRRRFLVAVIPGSIVRSLSDHAAAQDLELTAVVPLPSVLTDQLRKLQLPSNETVLLVADLGDALHLLLGKGDGTALFARTVIADTSSTGDRAHQEINRTLQFAQQQFGTHVSQLFVVGEEAFARLKDIPFQHGLKIHPTPIIEEPDYYARSIVTLAHPLRLNLAPPCPGRTKRVELMAARVVIGLCCLATACLISVETTVRAREYAQMHRARQLEAEAQLRANTGNLSHQAKRWRAFLQVVGNTNDVPVPEVFARYLSKTVPETMRLTRVDLNETSSPDAWLCRLDGVLRERGEGFISSMEAFERELSNGPFKLHIRDSTYQRLLRGGTEGGVVQPLAATRTDERAFFITGNIQ